MTAAKKSTDFDESKLAALGEPITVSVRKVIAGQDSPVTLPIKPGETVSGKGWTQDDVRELDQGFLHEHWSGGGKYKIAATGANGQQMKWESYWPETRWPELSMGKPISAPAAPDAPAFGQPFGQPAAPGVSWLSQVPTHPAFQPRSFGYGQSAYGAAQPPYGAPWSPYGPSFGSNPFSSQFSTPRSGGDEVQKEREARLQMEARIERERLENRYKEQLGAITNEMRQMQQQAQRPTGKSPEVEALERQLEAMKASQESDKLANMISESNRQTREMIAAMQATTQQQITAMQAALSARPSGPDPTMMVLIEGQKAQAQAQSESTRAQIDAQREIARMQADAAKEANRSQIGPNQLIEIIGKFNTGAEQTTQVMSRAWEMMMHSVETMMSAQGPSPHPAFELLGQAAQGGLALGARALQLREQQAIAQAQQQQIEAHLRAQAQAQASQGPTVPAGMAGVAEDEPDPNRQLEDDEPDQLEEGDPSSGNGAPRAPTAEEIVIEEAKLFGPARESIIRLRLGVEQQLINPQQCANAILQGIEHFADEIESIPVFQHWLQGDIARFLDVIFPHTNEAYKEKVIEILYDMAQKAGAVAASNAAQA